MINQNDMSTAEFLAGEAAGISKMLEATFENLALCLEQDYSLAIQPLEAEQESLAQERREIAETAGNLEAILPSFARTAERQADALVSEGQKEEAASKLAEAEAARNAPAKLRARLLEIETRFLAVEDEKKAFARRIAVTWWADCGKVTRAVERGFLVTLLGGLERSLAEFRRERGIEEWSYELDENARLANLLSNDDTVSDLGARLYGRSYPIAVRRTGGR